MLRWAEEVDFAIEADPDCTPTTTYSALHIFKSNKIKLEKIKFKF